MEWSRLRGGGRLDSHMEAPLPYSASDFGIRRSHLGSRSRFVCLTMLRSGLKRIAELYNCSGQWEIIGTKAFDPEKVYHK